MEYLPRPAQVQTQERMLAKPYQLVALRMGAGKTAATLTVVKELGMKTLVVAPKRVAELVWHTEGGKWDHLAEMRVQRVLGGPGQRTEALATPADVYVINRTEARGWAPGSQSIGTGGICLTSATARRSTPGVSSRVPGTKSKRRSKT